MAPFALLVCGGRLIAAWYSTPHARARGHREQTADRAIIANEPIKQELRTPLLDRMNQRPRAKARFGNSPMLKNRRYLRADSFFRPGRADRWWY